MGQGFLSGGAGARPVFTYWDSEDVSGISEQIDHWRGSFTGYEVVTPQDARALLVARSPEYLEAFDRIRIAACRSDISRLLALDAFGGLYVDSHCRLDDLGGVASGFDRLEARDMVVSTRWAPNFKKVMPHNSILWSRPGGRIVNLLLDRALANLGKKLQDEDRVGFEPYHVWSITGPGVLWQELFDTEADAGVLKPEWADVVATVFEAENPISRHIYTGYREPGSHWSERQKVERLFGPPRI